tara:strand:- start:46 stop:363 length:318 start_codon:yes stop_codon:yes gene_type:complete
VVKVHYDDEKAPNTIEEAKSRIIECIMVEFMDEEVYTEYPNSCFVNWNQAQQKRYLRAGKMVREMLFDEIETRKEIPQKVEEKTQGSTNLNKSMTIRDYMRAYVG